MSGQEARPIRRLLIANRGEIALRILRTAREMGIEVMAVYSEPDARALHSRLAERAIPLGGRTPAETYLDQDKLIAAAKSSGADAIHPGYGFLSENATFARRVSDEGLIWVGPPASAIEAMGDKIESRRRMQAAAVPLVPGGVSAIDDPEAAIVEAEAIGYPVALKAAGGGGGKGIRIVREASEIARAFRAASAEAVKAFGDGRIYLERYLDHPRHVEIQVMFDQHGNGVHLGERECSVQRRHQKLLEEAPSSAIDPAMRAAMGKAALDAGAAVDYVGAGTVEFLVSGNEFFFLEMNTRLQVEHPVTEMVTGLDLVREQIDVAGGARLSIAQEDVRFHGHSIEVRLNAEDPLRGFLPSTGIVKNLRWPSGPGVRIDAGLYRGMEVGLDYDPMLAKIIVWASDRPRAIERMRRALAELNVGGVKTGAPAAMAVLENEDFRRGHYDTHLLESMDLAATGGGEETPAAIAAALYRFHRSRRRALSLQADRGRAWLDRGRQRNSNWRNHGGAR
ncbi:MAG: acetyl-CoA carboxylase biotin carboxylase subunit [Planctomycetota bacterium]